MAPINLLATLDENYIPPLKTLIKSLRVNSPRIPFDLYLVYADITPEGVADIGGFCAAHNFTLKPIPVPAQMFDDAPVFRHYTKAMYYRLLAFELLPEPVEKVLYLDPDILVINPIQALYDIDISQYLFAGAMHTNMTGFTDHVNKIRLGNYEAPGYFNSGVLLMNLERLRQETSRADIFDYVKAHENELILPDQDILNGLYGSRILAIDDSRYNYDARNYNTYYITSNGEKDMDWVIDNTVILHFCGKNKPWLKSSKNRFGALYKHYARHAAKPIKQTRCTYD